MSGLLGPAAFAVRALLIGVQAWGAWRSFVNHAS